MNSAMCTVADGDIMAMHDWVSVMLGGAGFVLGAWRRFEIILQKGRGLDHDQTRAE